MSKIITCRKDIKNSDKKKIVLCHGVFDIFHVGHLMHLKNAKSHGDILVVSITGDKFVNKGPDRPYFNQSYRAILLSAIEFVDYVYISKSITAEKVLKDIKPDFYAKGQEYSDPKNDITKNIQIEKKLLKENNGKIVYTYDKKFSSTELLNNVFDIFSKEQKEFLLNLKKNYNNKKILELINSFSNIKVTLIGDALFDNYTYVNALGLASKSPTISSKFLHEEIYSGGVIAAAEMLASLGCEVDLILYNHKDKVAQKFLTKLNNNIKIYFSGTLNSSATIPTKIRFLNKTRDQKLFQVSKVKNISLSIKEENDFLKKIKRSTNKTDFLIILDFGYGVFNKNFISKIYKYTNNVYINVQTNSDNLGFNFFTKYKKYKYLSIDQREFELGLSKKINLENLNKDINKKNYLSITLGERGALFCNKKKFIFCPSFFLNAKDTTGCGDAYFAITSLLLKMGYNDQIVPFLGNCYAGLHSRIIGNKFFPSKVDLSKTIMALYL